MNKLSVFLSSSMTGELDQERLNIKTYFKLDNILKEFFELYAIDDHASPSKIEKTFTAEVAQSNILLLVLGKELRPPVYDEFNVALKHNVKIFCYIKRGIDRAPNLDKFIKDEVYPNRHSGEYSTSEELGEKIKNDLSSDIIKSYSFGNSQSTLFASPNNEYRFFPIEVLIENSKREDIVNLDRDQIITLAITAEEQFGDFRTSLMLIEIGLLKYPNDWMLHNNRGVVLDKMGLLDASLYSYQKVVKLNPNSDTALFNVGNTLKSLGRIEEAISYLKKSLEVFPQKIVALRSIIGCYLRLNKKEETLIYAEEAMKYSDDEAEKVNYALSLSINGKHEEALAICDNLTPISYYQIYAQARIYFNKKDYNESIIKIDTILQVGALDYYLAIDKFYCLSALGKINEAKEWITFIEENYPIHSNDYNNLGFELMDKYGLYREAIPLFYKSIESDPTEMKTWNNLQVCYAYLMDYEQAVKVSDSALSINSFDQKSIQNKFLSLTLLGRVDEAYLFVSKKIFDLLDLKDQYKEFEDKFKSELQEKMKNLGELFRQTVFKTNILSKRDGKQT
jgi:tetratricopeptide (TPR) repeat protein